MITVTTTTTPLNLRECPACALRFVAPDVNPTCPRCERDAVVAMFERFVHDVRRDTAGLEAHHAAESVFRDADAMATRIERAKQFGWD